ncbi:tetraacyldisaccharide 4'-kinase [Marinomonas pollencensis]|uniref:Tetraacyldisaccharide 4'-kinase n=1 Tax=Marinomonas pollencensis TaxID=491954 RepID=A0A3E0DVU1_9GAMM|nr:tetraacyldisaccharide 4'-kinase [Marinomonas pollencensis]REG85769.1 lipid-A-disaccharide kinase [Marinomonas pollencensis]
MNLEWLFSKAWYGNCPWTKVFLPLMPLVKKVVYNKRAAFLANPSLSYTAPVPVVVVGNISVGGTGKSPMVVALCELLRNNGFRPGIVSRGHGVKLTSPVLIDEQSMACEVGDEPAMLARRTQCPTVVYPRRAIAIQHLLSTTSVDVIICDDGMQHYALNRDIEIAMVDAQRGIGNGCLLPVGPLREPEERLDSVDYVVSIAKQMTKPLIALASSGEERSVLTANLSSAHLVSLDGSQKLAFSDAFSSTSQWHVMAGIGNPERFMQTLKGLGLEEPDSVAWFADHHAYQEGDIPLEGGVIMTEKDAVKCQDLPLTNPNIWYLPVSLVLPDALTVSLINKLQHIKEEKQS